MHNAFLKHRSRLRPICHIIALLPLHYGHFLLGEWNQSPKLSRSDNKGEATVRQRRTKKKRTDNKEEERKH